MIENKCLIVDTTGVSLLENRPDLGYNFFVVDSQKILTNRHAPNRIGARPPGNMDLEIALRACLQEAGQGARGL